MKLGKELEKSLNSKMKDKIAFVLGEDGAASDVAMFIPSGCTELDFKIVNGPGGGFPVGKITTVSGLEACVHPDTEIDVMDIVEKIKIGEVEALLAAGKTIKVKTVKGIFTEIKSFVNKGYLDSHETILENGLKTTVSKDHLYFTDGGWCKAQDLIPGNSKIYCDDGEYSTVESNHNVGKQPIVDIEVEHPDSCYFGNGMLHHNTGKSLLAVQAMANAQKMGGFCVYIDTEQGMNTDFAQRVGLNVRENFLHITSISCEDVINVITEVCSVIHNKKLEAKKEKKKPEHEFAMIVWDSVAATPTNWDMENENPDPGSSIAMKPRILSKNMNLLLRNAQRQNICFLFVNQLRERIGAMPGQDKYIEPGGRAIPYAASLRIRLQAIGKMKESASDPTIFGVKTRATIIKNRFGPPFRKSEFPIYFSHGIDDEESMVNILKASGKIGIRKGGPKGNQYYFEEDKEDKSKHYNLVGFRALLRTSSTGRKQALALMEEALTMILKNPKNMDLEVVTSEKE